MSAFPPIEQLLPHRSPNLLISAVTAYDSDSISAHALVQAGQWYSNPDGSMPNWLGIELMAQAIAAYVGLEARQRGRPPKIGYLLGSRAYTCPLPSFPAGSQIDIQANMVFRDSSGLGAFDCTLSLAGKQIAEATLKVYEEPDGERPE